MQGHRYEGVAQERVWRVVRRHRGPRASARIMRKVQAEGSSACRAAGKRHQGEVEEVGQFENDLPAQQRGARQSGNRKATGAERS